MSNSLEDPQPVRIPRRQALIGFLALGSLRCLPAWASHDAEALVLSCIDFRFIHGEQDFLKTLNLEDHYDWTALAGASLALAGFPHTEDATAFWDQLEISWRLHHIRRVIIVDHQDCGAFALKLDSFLSQDPIWEQQIHKEYLQKAAEAIQQRYPELNVETYFASLEDGMIRIV